MGRRRSSSRVPQGSSKLSRQIAPLTGVPALRFRTEPVEHCALARINGNGQRTRPAARIVGPGRTNSDIEAVGLSLKFETRRPGELDGRAGVDPSECGIGYEFEYLARAGGILAAETAAIAEVHNVKVALVVFTKRDD